MCEKVKWTKIMEQIMTVVSLLMSLTQFCGEFFLLLVFIFLLDVSGFAGTCLGLFFALLFSFFFFFPFLVHAPIYFLYTHINAFISSHFCGGLQVAQEWMWKNKAAGNLVLYSI